MKNKLSLWDWHGDIDGTSLYAGKSTKSTYKNYIFGVHFMFRSEYNCITITHKDYNFYKFNNAQKNAASLNTSNFIYNFIKKK